MRGAMRVRLRRSTEGPDGFDRLVSIRQGERSYTAGLRQANGRYRGFFIKEGDTQGRTSELAADPNRVVDDIVAFLRAEGVTGSADPLRRLLVEGE